MSDRELSVLLDRAVREAPQMHLSGSDMLAAGRGRVRRRRAVGVGGAAGAAVLVAALWGGLAGGDGSLLGTREIQPAGPVWDVGEPVDGTLFAGFQTIDGDGADHTYEARLTRPSGEGPLTLMLSDGGEVVEEVPARSTVPGLEVFAGERMTVALWAEPEGVEASSPLVGPIDQGGPSSVQRAEVSGEQVGYAVWAGDVVDLPRSVDDVYLVGRDEVVSLAGAAVESDVLRAGDSRAVVWTDPSRGVWGYAVDGQDGSGVEQLGHRPAHAGSHLYAEEGWTGVVAVLPEGATADGASAVAGGSADSTTLGERAVVLAAIEDAAAPPVPFTLDGTAFLLDPYVDDLMTLETTGDRALGVEVRDGSVTLSDGSGASPVELAQEDLVEGLVVRPVGGEPVVVASGWDPGSSVLTASRVEVAGSDGPEWVVPRDVAQVVMPDGTLVTLLTVDELRDGEVTAVGRQVGGDVERWERPLLVGDGVEWREADGEVIPFARNEPLERLDDGAGIWRHYAGAHATAPGFLVVPGVEPEEPLVPVVERDGRVRAAGESVLGTRMLEAGEGTTGVVALAEPLHGSAGSQVVDVARGWTRDDAQIALWRPTEDGPVMNAGFVMRDLGLDLASLPMVTVWVDQGLWALSDGSLAPEELQVARTGDTALLHDLGADGHVAVVAVLPTGARPTLLGVGETPLGPDEVRPGEEPGFPYDIAIWVAPVADPASFGAPGAGVDTDGDGDADVPVVTDP